MTSNPKFRNVAVSPEAFKWIQKERDRTGLKIYTIVDSALVHLASLNKGNKNVTTKTSTDILK